MDELRQSLMADIDVVIADIDTDADAGDTSSYCYSPLSVIGG